MLIPNRLATPLTVSDLMVGYTEVPFEQEVKELTKGPLAGVVIAPIVVCALLMVSCFFMGKKAGIKAVDKSKANLSVQPKAMV